MTTKTDAQKRAQREYMLKFSRLEIRVSPQERDEIQAYAQKAGESVAGFMKRAVFETMEREKRN